MEYIRLKTKFPKKVTNLAIKEAMSRESEYAKHKKDLYASRLKEFEQKYGMSSDKFYREFEKGKLGDEEDFFEWYAIKEAYNYWKQTSNVLKNVSID